MSRIVEQILELARWAPSGDNTQPWRFQIKADDHVVIHGFDTRAHCVYDLTGHPSQIALGALLETLRIAASGSGLTAQVRRLDAPETQPTFDVRLVADAAVVPSPLIPCITARAVQRRPMKTRPLLASQKQMLEASLGPDHRVVWLEGWGQRFAAARLMFASAEIRLTIPEAYEVHKRVIEWNAQVSADKIPDQAIGLDAMTLRLMRWAMGDWRRIAFLNKYLAGTLGPRVQLDFLPGLACAAHFLLVARERPNGIDDFVAAGGAMQRFWLTATHVGLNAQPEMTPLIFAGYAREGRRFTQTASALAIAQRVQARLEALFTKEIVESAVFMGRLGSGPSAVTRSQRLPLEDLCQG